MGTSRSAVGGWTMIAFFVACIGGMIVVMMADIARFISDYISLGVLLEVSGLISALLISTFAIYRFTSNRHVAIRYIFWCVLFMVAWRLLAVQGVSYLMMQLGTISGFNEAILAASASIYALSYVSLVLCPAFASYLATKPETVKPLIPSP